MTLIKLSIKISKTAPAKTCTFQTDWKKCCIFKRRAMNISPICLSIAVISWLRPTCSTSLLLSRGPLFWIIQGLQRRRKHWGGTRHQQPADDQSTWCSYLQRLSWKMRWDWKHWGSSRGRIVVWESQTLESLVPVLVPVLAILLLIRLFEKANCNLYRQSSSELIPFLFAINNVNYAQYTSVHHKIKCDSTKQPQMAQDFCMNVWQIQRRWRCRWCKIGDVSKELSSGGHHKEFCSIPARHSELCRLVIDEEDNIWQIFWT